MNQRANKHQVIITDRKTGQKSLSKPMPPGKYRAVDEKIALSTSSADSDLTTSSNQPTTGNDSSTDMPPKAVQQSMTGQAFREATTTSTEKNVGHTKSKPEIETLEQFIAHAYARKGQRVALKEKVVRNLGNKCVLDEPAMHRLMQLANADKLLVVPRQLLLVSLEVKGNPAMKGGLLTFVKDVMLQHPIFADLGVQHAIQNLPEAVSIAQALAIIGGYKPQNVDGQDEVKDTTLQSLRSNAIYLLSTWFVCHRGLTLDALAKLLLDVMWKPAASELTDDTSRLRALTEVEQPASIGWVSQRFLRDVAEASWTRDRAEDTAQSLRQQLSEVEGRLQEVSTSLESRTNELDSLRVSSAEALAQQHKQTEAEMMHLRHELEQLRGRLVRRLDDSVEMLEVGLNALRNKTPRIEVMLERAELVVDALRAEKNNLKEE